MPFLHRPGLFVPSLVLALAACGGGSSGPEPESPSPTRPASPEPPASAENAGSAESPEPIMPATPEATFAAGSNAFAFDLLHALGEHEGNLAFSPASVSMALAMTSGGARGETAAEMARVLHLALGDTAHAEAGELLETWNDPAEHDYELRVVNRLFAAESLALAPAFVELTSARYAAPVEALDFASAPEPSRARINDYIEEQTRQRIKDLLPPGSVDRTTRLVLTNAVYLLAKWQSPFEANSTRPASFHTGGRALAVPTMHQTGQFAFAEVSGVKALELRYRGGDFAMVFLLPATNDGLPALERELNGERLGAILEALEPTRVRVALPKVKLDPPAPLALGAVLASMGMPLAFSGDADFGGMVADPSQERLAISEVFHKAFVLIDEEGTEAAAATAVVMVRSAAMPQPDAATFIADHPYLFLLRDLRSGALLFVGRVVDPS